MYPRSFNTNAQYIFNNLLYILRIVKSQQYKHSTQKYNAKKRGGGVLIYYTAPSLNVHVPMNNINLENTENIDKDITCIPS